MDESDDDGVAFWMHIGKANGFDSVLTAASFWAQFGDDDLIFL